MLATVRLFFCYLGLLLLLLLRFSAWPLHRGGRFWPATVVDVRFFTSFVAVCDLFFSSLDSAMVRRSPPRHLQAVTALFWLARSLPLYVWVEFRGWWCAEGIGATGER
uniref:Uncharacterized protein n=1 Tax=Opuntia streptacantha TaxID=393608 RepID=A0A7C9CZ44_OPUST